MIEELIQRTFATRNAAHLHHWRTDSYSQHSALNEFYDDVLDGIDTLVEAYQGAFELVEVDSLPELKYPKDIIKQLESDLIWIGKSRAKITKGLPSLDNKLQEIEAVYLKAVYKLKNLK